MKMLVDESQMAAVRSHLFKKYPYLSRKNTAYTAKLISTYEIEFEEKWLEEIKSALS